MLAGLRALVGAVLAILQCLPVLAQTQIQTQTQPENDTYALDWFEPLIALLGLIKQWQTLIGAMIGFTGVAFTIYFTAKRNRENAAKAAEDILKRDDRLRDQDAKALAAELQEEVAAINLSITQRLYLVKQASNDPQILPSMMSRIGSIKTPIHDKSIGRLGILGTQRVSQIEMLYGKLLPMAESGLVAARETFYMLEHFANNLENLKERLDQARERQDDPELIESAQQLIDDLTDTHKVQRAQVKEFINSAHSFYEEANEYAGTLGQLLRQFTDESQHQSAIG
jgi:large-conductance mechanosensitive channel